MDTQVANTRINHSQRPKPRHAKESTLWFDLRAITPGKDVAKPPRSDLRLMPVTHLGGCVLFRLQAAPRRDPSSSRRAFCGGRPFGADRRSEEEAADTIRRETVAELGSCIARCLRLRHKQKHNQ